MLLPGPDVLPAPSPLTFYEPVRNRRHIILNQALLSAGPGTVPFPPPSVNLLGGFVNQPRREPTGQGEGKVWPLLVLMACTTPLRPGEIVSRTPPPQTPLPRGAVRAYIKEPTHPILSSEERPARRLLPEAGPPRPEEQI